MYDIILRDEAKVDLKAAFDWYELAKEGMGEGFILLVKKYTNELKYNAEQHQIINKNKKAVFF